ncbi:MAG: glycosyltransferase family 4 protein [Candidatus Thermoplasmatota archaeon]|nr:glycosyltransferase family 4 protein [Candidatus Thermoplasmatota archaeon]
MISELRHSSYRPEDHASNQKKVTKIGIVIRFLGKSNGPTKLAIGQALSLVKQGYSADVIILRKDKAGDFINNMIDQATSMGVTFFTLSREWKPLSWLNYLSQRAIVPMADPTTAFDWYSFLRGYFFLRRSKYDYLIMHDQYCALDGLFLHLLNGSSYAVYLHEGVKSEFIKSTAVTRFIDFYIRLVLGNAKSIFANTRSTGEVVNYLLPNRKVSVAYQPSPFPLRVRESKKDETDNFTLLSVSTWDLGRSPDWYFNIAKALKNCKLVMGGHWKDSNIEEFYKKLSLTPEFTGKIEITGSITEDDLENLYSRSDIFIRIGNREKGTGLGIVEAISQGLPVLINEGIGSSELVENSDCGIVLKGKDSDEVSINEAVSLIDSLRNDKVRLRQMSMNCQKYVEKISWDRHLEIIMEGLGL